MCHIHLPHAIALAVPPHNPTQPTHYARIAVDALLTLWGYARIAVDALLTLWGWGLGGVGWVGLGEVGWGWVGLGVGFFGFGWGWVGLGGVGWGWVGLGGVGWGWVGLGVGWGWRCWGFGGAGLGIYPGLELPRPPHWPQGDQQKEHAARGPGDSRTEKQTKLGIVG